MKNIKLGQKKKARKAVHKWTQNGEKRKLFINPRPKWKIVNLGTYKQENVFACKH